MSEKATSKDIPKDRLPPALIEFRRATGEDIPAIKALQEAAYARNRRLLGVEPLPLKADYSDILSHMEVWLAEERQELKGVLILDVRPEDLLIWSLAASPNAQGQGLGQIMLDAAEVRAGQLGHTVIRLCTGAKLVTLIGWYKRHGYEVVETEQLDDRVIQHMKKTLLPAKADDAP